MGYRGQQLCNAKLVRIYQGVIHFVPKVQDFMHYKDITFTGKRVTPCGSNSCNRYIRYRHEIVVVQFYLISLFIFIHEGRIS